MESLVAIAILTLAIAGPLTIVSNGITNTAYAKDQITAVYLAQEGIEAIRNMRDSDALAGILWLQGFDAACKAANSNCGITITGSPPVLGTKDCPTPEDDCRLYYESSTGLYSHEPNGEPTRFTRTFRVVPVDAKEARLTVTVAWQTNPTLPPRTFTVTEELLNWQ